MARGRPRIVGSRNEAARIICGKAKAAIDVLFLFAQEEGLDQQHLKALAAAANSIADASWALCERASRG